VGPRSFLRRVVTIVCLLVGGVGCNAAELSPEGANVATSNTTPIDQGFDPSGCKSLGYIVGRGGGSFGGAWVSNEDLVAYAMNDLRNQAAELGANYIQHDSPQMGVAGGAGTGSTTSTATVSGTAYLCSKRKGEGGENPNAAAPAAPTKRSESPAGAAGFSFGSTVEESRQLCTEKYEWTASDATRFACSGTPRAVGVNATTLLKFCEAKLCKIDLIVSAASDESKVWLETLRDVDAALEKKYGTPTEHSKKLPPECREDILPCVRQGTAWLKYIWQFDGGTTITLRMSNKPGPEAAIRATYALEVSPPAPAL